MMQAIKMQTDFDSKEEIINAVGENLKEIPLTGAQVLIGIYKRPQKTKGGLILPDQTRDEDIWQGKVGLILKMGAMPMDDNDKQFFGEGNLPKEGDWIVFRPSDGWPISVGKQPCRVLDDRRRIKMKIADPSIVW